MNRRSDLIRNEDIEFIKSTAKSLEIESNNQTRQFNDFSAQIQLQSSKLLTLERTITEVLCDIEKRLSRLEFSIEDIDQTMSGKLTVIQAETSAAASHSALNHIALTELLTRMDAQQNQISGMVTPPHHHSHNITYCLFISCELR